MRHTGPPQLLALLAALPLAGACEFWIAPEPVPPDPNLDGVLRCGDEEELIDIYGGQALQVDVAERVGVELITHFDQAWDSARLATTSDSDLSRVLEIWDPIRGVRVLSGMRSAGEELRLEFVSSGQGLVEGTMDVRCYDPGEVCFDLSDDDSDGRIDCADLACARDLDCTGDQQDLVQVDLECSAAMEALPPPSVGALDRQQTIYTTHPGGEGQPPHEFWGGAEVVITEAEAPGTIVLSFDGEGMVCPGTDQGAMISCLDPVRVQPGQEYSFDASQLPLYLEPLDLTWPGLSAQLACEQG